MDVMFAGGSGLPLTGTLDLPAGPQRATALFAHCFTCSRTSHAAARISKALAGRGIAVLRFDFTGLGASAGEFADTTFTSNVDDLVAAAQWMESDAGPGAPTLLVGHSLGGAAVIAAAAHLPGVVGVATVGAPASPAHIAHLLGDFDVAPAETGAGHEGHRKVQIGGRTLAVGQRLLDDIAEQPQRECIAGLRRPLLVLHSPIDEIVGVENAREIFDAARHPKSFVALDGADHLLDRHADAEFAAAMIATWAERYLPDVEDPDPVVPGTVRVTETTRDSFAHEAETATHTWVLDEPEDVGGADAGPNPYDTLLSALGACTSMTMRMYARRKGWDFGGTRVTLTHERQHAADCEACETQVGFIDHLHRTIELDPALTADQRESLLTIADKCPVHRTLTHEVHITTELSTEATP